MDRRRKHEEAEKQVARVRRTATFRDGKKVNIKLSSTHSFVHTIVTETSEVLISQMKLMIDETPGMKINGFQSIIKTTPLITKGSYILS